MQASDLLAHLGNALPHQLGVEAEVVAVGPACLTMTGIAAWMTTWKGVHVNGKRQVLREASLAAAAVGLALSGKPAREAGLTETTDLQLEKRS